MSELIKHADIPAKELSRTRHNKAILRRQEENFDKDFPWGYFDSPLQEPYPTGQSYENTFQRLIPPEHHGDIRSYIESELKDKRGEAIGIDIGGLGSSVFHGFSSGFFRRTAGISLHDIRAKYGIEIEEDTIRGHTVIEGDITKRETKVGIVAWLGGKKVDLLFERMVKGLTAFPRKDRWTATAISQMYSLLSDDAIMFAELVFFAQEDPKYYLIDPQKMKEWVKDLNDRFEGFLQAKWDGGSLMIRKRSGAPDDLPPLPITEKEQQSPDQRPDEQKQQRLSFEKSGGWLRYGRIPYKIRYHLDSSADESINERNPGSFAVTQDLNLDGSRGMSLSIWVYDGAPKVYKDIVMFHELTEAELMFADGIPKNEAHSQAVARTEAYAKTHLTPEEFENFITWQKTLDNY